MNINYIVIIILITGHKNTNYYVYLLKRLIQPPLRTLVPMTTCLHGDARDHPPSVIKAAVSGCISIQKKNTLPQ